MIGSLYSGISGLKANTSAMAVIGDNIANVGTNGFKGSRVSFSNVFSATIGQSKTQIGRGVTMSAVSPSWETGSFENTNNATDLSINGKGLFVVRNPADGVQYYTRAGQFEFDKDNYLVTQDGLIVQGYPIDASGNLGGLTDLTMPAGNIAPQATDLITLDLNLNAGATAAEPFNTMLTVYDSLGNAVGLTFTFTPDLVAAAADPNAATVWDWTISSSAGACATAGSIAFDASGDIVPASCSPASSNPTLVVTGLSGADLSIDWEYLDASGVSDGSITGYAAKSTKSSQTQNGFPSGTLQGVAVDEDGVFTGVYSNGQTSPFAQIALADFGSYSGLSKMGSNLFSESLASGQAVISVPATGSVGSIAPSTLEMSNVDLATEFVELITTQRAFQANSKVITTSDEILAELINIKR